MTAHEQFADDLALYALGALENAERTALEAHLEQCALCRRELQQLQGDLGLLGLSTAGPAPPARARARLLAAVAKEPRARVVEKSVWRWWAWAFVAAATVLAVISITLWRQNQALRRDMAMLAAQSGQNKVEAERAKEVMAVLTAPEAVRVTLVATNAKPQPQGKAIYVPRTGGLVFVASNFPPVPANKAYELWLLPASGAPPIPAGVFKPDARGSAHVLLPPLARDVQAKAFAVTIEPEAGSATPTLPIVLAGGQ
jgi:anti-sigma-K factor RskA